MIRWKLLLRNMRNPRWWVMAPLSLLLLLSIWLPLLLMRAILGALAELFDALARLLDAPPPDWFVDLFDRLDNWYKDGFSSTSHFKP